MKRLQNHFKNLLAMEKKARDMYAEAIQNTSDEEIAEKLKFIEREEFGHIKLAEKLVGISKAAEQRKGVPQISKDALSYIRVDFVLKRRLLTSVIQLLATKTETFTLLSLLGRKSKKFEKADRLRKDFISTIAHQFKTPLTVTKYVLSEFIDGGEERERELTEGQKEMAEQMTTANKSMFSLVDDLLEVNRIEGRRGELEKFELIQLLREILKELDYLIVKKKQKVIFPTFKKNIMLFNDRKAINKIIFNLLTNAINYGKKKGKIKVDIKKERGKKILVSVSDDGIGIPEDEKKNIFKKFYRASNAVKFNPGGTGLGLYIVKKLAKKIKGKIWFESEENKGTTFSIALPFFRQNN